MTRAGDVKAAWVMLGRPVDNRLQSFALIELGRRAVRAALDSDDDRHLLVPLTKALPELPADGEAVRFEIRHLAFAEDTGLFLDVECVDAAVYPEFDLLIEDVLEAAASGTEAGAAALGAIDRWRRFLALRKGRHLTFLEQMGLMAELTVLDRALDLDPFAIDSWRGPFREPHDFEFDNGCIEVKAIGEDLKTVEIHGLHQLSSHDDRALTLVLVEVHEDADGLDIRSYAEEICETHEVDLHKALSALGIDLDEQDDGLSKFRAGTIRTVPVDGRVPHLIAADSASEAEISGVRYSLRIAALLPLVTGTDLDLALTEVGTRA